MRGITSPDPTAGAAIVVVDDDPGSLNLSTGILRAAGYSNIHPCFHPREALKFCWDPGSHRPSDRNDGHSQSGQSCPPAVRWRARLLGHHSGRVRAGIRPVADESRVCEDRAMCVNHDAELPALPPGSQTPVSERIVLEAADGNRFNAFAAEPTEPTGTAVIVLPDVRGLFEFYEDLACRFAADGHRSVAIDYFGRTAGIETRGSDFPYMDHIAKTFSDGLNADIAAAINYLRDRDASARIYTVGFCFGGAISWGAATHGHGLAGAVGFYGRPDADRPAGDGPIWDRCHLIECPILALFGGDDPGIPAENISRFGSALEAAGVSHEVVTYPGAPHSFFDRSQGEFSDESLDAWNRMTGFLNQR